MKTKEIVLKNSSFQYSGPYSETFNFIPINTYDPNNNYLLSQLCGLSYTNKENIHKQIKVWNTNNNTEHINCKIIDIDSFRCIILHTDEYIIVIFRGSDNINNWLADFDIALVPYNNDSKQLVHEGFRDSIIKMQHEINEYISEIRRDHQNIYITGHSLGGAQAILSGFLCNTLIEFSNITTFGEPKIGNLNLVNLFNKSLNSSPPSVNSRIFRNVNKYDPVIYVPVNYWTTFYYHEGFFYVFAPSIGGQYEIETTGNTTNETIIDLPTDQHEMINWNINRHSIGLYIQNAEANKTNNPF